MRKISIVIPVYNEEALLPQVLPRLFALETPGWEKEWIVVDDHSTDKSPEILKALVARFDFQLIEQPQNQGKGAAVARGIQSCSGEAILIQDADFEYDPRDIPSLLQPLADNRADIVFGSRFKKSSLQVHRTYHYLVNRFLTILSNLFSGMYLTDMETCYKLFPADLMKSMNLRSKRFGIEVELTAYVAKTSARVVEVPINYYPRTQLQGKKINWKDGVAALFHLFRFNFWVSLDDAYSGLPPRYRPARSRLVEAPAEAS